MFITAHKRSLRRLCFYKCLSVHRRGDLPQCMLGYNPNPGTRGRTPLPGTRGRHPPGIRGRRPGSRHPPCTVHAGRYGQQAGGTHPTGMHTCFSVKNKILLYHEKYCRLSRICQNSEIKLLLCVLTQTADSMSIKGHYLRNG